MNALFLLFFLCLVTLSAYQVDLEVGNGELKYAKVPASVSGIDEVDEKGYTRLMIAAMTGQLEPLDNYIAGGADVNILTADGNSALMLAIKGRFYYTAMQLIRAKTNLEQRNRYGMTPLLMAVIAGHQDIVVGLLDYGADPNIASNDGSTALMMAAQIGSIGMVETLLKRGALVNQKSHAGDTALMFACATGQVAIVKLLLQNGADPALTNNNGYTALIFASLRGQGAVIEEIGERFPHLINARDALGRSALDHAIYNSHQRAIESLVVKGADLPRSGYRVEADVLRRRQEYLAETAKRRLKQPASST